MRYSLLLLISSALIAGAVRWDKETTNHSGNGRGKGHASHAHRRSNGASASEPKHSKHSRPITYSEEEDYDWIDPNEDASDVSDHSMQAFESVTANSPPHDIFTCCNQVFGSCRTACENLSLVQLDGNNGRDEPRTELRKSCPLHQLDFWSCVNITLEAVNRGKSWSGRRCCQTAVLPQCKNACATAAASQEVNDVCRRSDEQVLYDCFEHHNAADSCCGKARTSECLQACREVFEPPNETAVSGSSSAGGNLVDVVCGERNSDVVQCIHNHTDMTPPLDAEKYLPCCDYSEDESCHRTCKDVLQASKLHQKAERSDVIIGRLEAGCGTPLPHVRFWQCFLTVTGKLYVPAGGKSQRRNELASNGDGAVEPNKLGFDAAKRQCCEQASSHKCRRLCIEIFTNNWWETRVSFETECLEQPTELDLKRCIESVDAPCELGCKGLSFCTNFNNRPTELFRSCSAAHDAAAREDFLMLQQRGFVRVLGQELFIKNTTRCAPDKWQALVCALQIQPCTRVGMYNGICREDCAELLDECLDWTRQPQRPQAICDRLQPPGRTEADEHTPCISLGEFLKPSEVSKEMDPQGDGLTSPCAAKPCNASEVCVLQRSGSQGYACIPGCSLGQASTLLVPFGAFVRVGKTSVSRGLVLASDQLLTAEHEVCRCGLHGSIAQCQPLPSYMHAHCNLPRERSFRHGSSFYLECNQCSCFAGEITCTKQQCRLPDYVDAGYTSLPCNCAAHFVPVCGANGNTYPSACVAKCLGLQDSSFVYGACNARNACSTGAHSCPAGSQCLERRQVCLSSMQRPCAQYICVNVSSPHCGTDLADEVCDKQGKTHPNACSLLRNNAQLAYWGACRPGHDLEAESTPVCGINGVTYRSRHAAWADYVLVDYIGRCREVGLLASDMGSRCKTVKCPSPVSPYCRNIVPPGACCPICGGGAFRIIYSRKQLDRAYYALRGERTSLLTLRGILQQLDHLVQVSECQLTGFLSMEVGIFVALVPRGQPTGLQVKACEAEAEKISTLISSQSPRITTNLALSSLIVSHMLESTPNAAATVPAYGYAPLLFGLLVLAFFSLKRACII
ncbi:reversion-inducing cysteine-rich protein with Kazal motifs [Drosophila albomicans]|uniref:Reversion-inducing cysteine-rich protein with Kazal motifs n=1 Tax=Drosophila albomicans TaxID=7291 RepID=A0A6P8X289_DROAB|nr:reversion-inducing cysteine-rich protein with Kazal motifs [Drosophila albomicans]XP_034105822.1 reversion-inducing cysteine-rich protein with Kazal motifs [Drosophila albomicans]XP_034105823.1 reversion-inducing cysteine-rich protein with Kazal motifs [Drosophila albomicans]